jgi:hypothetical protein
MAKKHSKHVIEHAFGRRFLRNRRVSWYTIESQLQACEAKTLTEFRSQLRKIVDDDKLWELIEVHDQATKAARAFHEEASKRARKIVERPAQ